MLPQIAPVESLSPPWLTARDAVFEARGGERRAGPRGEPEIERRKDEAESKARRLRALHAALT